MDLVLIGAGEDVGVDGFDSKFLRNTALFCPLEMVLAIGDAGAGDACAFLRKLARMVPLVTGDDTLEEVEESDIESSTSSDSSS